MLPTLSGCKSENSEDERHEALDKRDRPIPDCKTEGRVEGRKGIERGRTWVVDV
jgi:hypothetical protein